MKTNEMMSQEEVVKVLNGTKEFVEDATKLFLKVYGTNLDPKDKDQIEAFTLFKKGLALYSDLIDIVQADTIYIMDTNQKVNQMYEVFKKI